MEYDKLRFKENGDKIDLLLIGRIDLADFPSLELFGIEVKVDTGAYNSSLNCHNVEVVTRNGEEVLKCNLLDPSHPQYDEREVYFKHFTERKVKSSNGTVEERYMVSSEIAMFGTSYPIKFTLSERSDMKYSVLLGRTFLRNRFLVDVSKTNLSAKELQNNINQK